jgi:16S rRNA (cytidine1402-2'-O)-methyltransferase
MHASEIHDPPLAGPDAAMETTGTNATAGTNKATLYVVATPIGNLADVSARAVQILRSVHAIAAEDTRITRRLLDHYDINVRLLAVHEHNEAQAAGAVLDILASGASVALVSDAGTPAISDPGARLVALVRAAGHAVSPIPGANAAAAAMSVSGFLSPHFLFYGFLPARASARREALAGLAALPYALIFYEAPHRVAECVDDLLAAMGPQRRILFARELTKLFEETQVCALDDAPAWLAANAHRAKGEFVLVVEGAVVSAPDDLTIDKTLAALLEELPLKQAVALAVKITGGNRSDLYQRALVLKAEGREM